ncbi:histone acetyltransferase [Sarracenia purpurea var. burkii]
MEPELAIPLQRRIMQDKISEFLLQRQQQAHDMQPKRFLDIVKRLDESLFRHAATKEEYMSLETLENRLHVLIMRLNNHNQQYSQLVNSTSPTATMMPTPGVPQSGNSSLMVTSCMDTSMIAASGGYGIVPVTGNTGSLLPTANGLTSNAYQQSLSNFPITSSGTNLVSSTGVQRMTSQMIPTPGFNSDNHQSFMNLESSNDTGGFSTVESTMVSQPLQQKQHVSGQNSRILHNLGSHIGGGIRSGLLQKSYGFSNGPLNGGLGIMRSNLQFINGSGTSEGYLTTTSYGNSPKPLQHYDQHQQPLIQGDGYRMSTPDSSGSGNFYAPVTSTGSALNNQNLNPSSLQSLPRTTSPMVTNQSNLHATQQVAHIKSQSVDQSVKMNFQASSSVRENLLQSHHQQQFQQQQPLQLQQQQFVQNQLQQKQQIHQHYILSKNDSFGHSQVTSDIDGQLNPEHGMECHDGNLHSQLSQQLQFSAEDHSRCTQFLSFPSVSQDIYSSSSQTSQQRQQLLHPHQLVVDSQNELNCLSVGGRSEVLLPAQWNPKSQDRSQIPGNLLHEQNIQEEFRQRIAGQDEAQRNNLSSEGPTCQTVVTDTVHPLTSVGAVYRSVNPNRELQFKKQQRWLLFLRHARRCMAPEGKCQEVNCITVQKLWFHLERCNISQCLYPRCHHTKILLNHHKHCRDTGCPVCVPVRNFLQTHRKARTRSDCNPGLPYSINGSCKSFDARVIAAQLTSKTSSPVVETLEDLQPSLKRVKTELPFQSLVPEIENSFSVPTSGEPNVLSDAQGEDYQHGDTCNPMKAEVTEVKMEVPVSSGQGSPDISYIKKDNLDDTNGQKPVSEPIISDDPAGSAQQGCTKSEKDMDQAKQATMTLPAENAAGTKSGKPKIKGVSLTELFTPEQIRKHIIGLRQWVGQVSLCICLADPYCPYKI